LKQSNALSDTRKH